MILWPVEEWRCVYPNGSSGGWTGLDLTGPRLDYDINFTETGTYRLWVRTAGASGNDDSFHAGLDGVGLYQYHRGRGWAMS